MTSDRRIRPASLKDSGVIAKLSTQLGYPSSPAQIRKRLKEVFEDKSHGLFVAETPGGSVAGFVHVYMRPDVVVDREARVGALVVEKHHRRQGIGRLLIREAEGWAQRRRCSILRLSSNVIRNEAKLFYEQLGFEHSKTQRVFHKRLLKGR